MTPDAYVTIDLDAIRRNAAAFCARYPEYRAIIAVVKGDAYGHGMRAAAAMEQGGIRHFAVASLEEARDLRAHTAGADILCLEPVALDRLEEAAELRLTLPISDSDYLDAFLRAAGERSFKLHLQIDAGFNRLGFKDAQQIAGAVQRIGQSPHTLEGIYQHFATPGIYDRQYDDQIRRFRELTAVIDLSAIPLVHLGSGVSLLAHPKIDIATAVRVGLALYGYNIAPSSYGNGVGDRLRSLRDGYYRRRYHLTPTLTDVQLPLEPAMRYQCRILQIKEVKKGERVGYNAAEPLREDVRIAILPVGYNNGIGHANHGRTAEINGRLCPVIGAVGMNMTAVRVDDSVCMSDPVTLLGGKITLGMFSRASGLGLAEALVSLGKSNPREYKYSDR